jgi:DNA-binding CsgD family transcriptional regulator
MSRTRSSEQDWEHNALSSTYAKVLDDCGIGCVICASDRDVVHATPCAESIARRVLGVALRNGEALPAPLARATMKDAVAEARLEGPDGRRAVRVRVLAMSDGSGGMVLSLREDFERNHALMDHLNQEYGVNARQFELLEQLALGRSNRDIADRLQLTQATVKSYLSRLFHQLGVRSRGEAVALTDRLRRGR